MEDTINLLIEDCLTKENKLYFFPQNTNVLCVLDLNIGDIQFLDCMPEENIFGDRLCAKILEWQQDLVFIPANARKLWRYNIKKRKWHSIELGKYANMKNKIFQAVIYGNVLIMIGCSCPVFFRIDLVTEQLEITEFSLKNMLSINETTSYACSFCRGNIVQTEKELMIASGISNTVIRYDLKNKQLSCFELGGKKNLYSGIAWDGKYFWLAPRYKTPIVRWNGLQQVMEYELSFDELDCEIGFWGIRYIQGKLILLGKKKFSVLITDECQNIVMQKMPKTYIMLKEEDDYTYSMSHAGMLFIENDSECKFFRLSVSKGIMREFQYKKINNCMIEIPDKESQFFMLDDYLENCIYFNKINTMCNQKYIGNRIWNRIERNL